MRKLSQDKLLVGKGVRVYRMWVYLHTCIPRGNGYIAGILFAYMCSSGVTIYIPVLGTVVLASRGLS